MWIYLDLPGFGREVRVRYSCVWIEKHLKKYWSKGFIRKVMARIPRKKSKVSYWFNGVIRETLERETESKETVTVQPQVKTADRVPKYQSVQSTSVDRIPEHTEYQSV